MTTTLPWAPQTGPAPQIHADPAPQLPPPPPSGPPPAGPPPPHQVAAPQHGGSNRTLWFAAAGVVILMVVAIAATAAITYAITRENTAPAPAAPQPTSTAPAAPQFSAAERKAADSRLCSTFDTATKGQQGQGGLIQNGALNVPLALRTVNGAVAVQNTLTPAVSPDLAKAAQTFVDRSLDSVTAALANAPIDEGNRLNDISNTAVFALADACGLPH